MAIPEKVQTTLGELVEAEEALSRLAAQPMQQRLAYHLRKLVALVTAELRDHFHAPRIEMVRELGRERQTTGAERARSGQDKTYEVKPENMPQFVAKVDELRAVPVELPWRPFDLAQLGESFQISARDLAALGALVHVDEPATDAADKVGT